MEELFARRRERAAEDRVSSLRYCARAVESAWKRVEDLAGPVRRRSPPELDARRRLASLARAIPEGWARTEGFPERVLALAGDPPTIEAGLAAIDARMLEAAATRLGVAERRTLAGWVEERLAVLAPRFAADDLARAAARLESRELRRREGLPLLSLFSPDAERDDDPASSPRG